MYARTFATFRALDALTQLINSNVCIEAEQNVGTPVSGEPTGVLKPRLMVSLSQCGNLLLPRDHSMTILVNGKSIKSSTSS